ncbi:DEAD-box ATP-dependent RNA helicase 14 [Astathelohania contejeani]|uniref:ATP-dependent RNA helicase n=1 Tax=Astathelohania contejeani TaxID=164912 RepID=A0ABQ7I2Y1_9MICR|nr:DEAD-box ATP-dependent RNA helicase 14 [Thelohania contejeani]
MLDDLRNKILNSQFKDSIENISIELRSNIEDTLYREKHNITINGNPILSPMQKWDQKNENGFYINSDLQEVIPHTLPSPVQAQTIPYIINGVDFVAISATGTGKTLAFVIPLIELLSREEGRAIILAPTKELAHQIEQVFTKYNQEISTCLLVGGHPIELQLISLNRFPAVIIGTPGRIAEISRMGATMENIKYLVVDEYDRIVNDKVFISDYKFVTSQIIPHAIKFYFSATPDIGSLGILSIKVGNSNHINKNIKEEFVNTTEHTKLKYLLKMLDSGNRTIIFCNTIKKVDWLSKKLAFYKPRALHSRIRGRGCLDGINTNVIISTDLGSRGLHIEGIELVINYDCPNKMEDYIHRVGRTGRFMSGRAVTFLNEGEKLE